MPLNEIPRHLNAETRGFEAALEDAWQELRKDGNVEAKLARSTLRTTMVALASVGETDLESLSRSPFMLGAGDASPMSGSALAVRDDPNGRPIFPNSARLYQGGCGPFRPAREQEGVRQQGGMV